MKPNRWSSENSVAVGNEAEVAATEAAAIATNYLKLLQLCSAKNTLSGSKSFTQRFFPARIRDAGHREWTSLQLGNSLECSVVGLVAPPSANSDLVFLVQDWSVGGRDCNVPPNMSAPAECVSR